MNCQIMKICTINGSMLCLFDVCMAILSGTCRLVAS